jgi:hypothetical protein
MIQSKVISREFLIEIRMLIDINGNGIRIAIVAVSPEATIRYAARYTFRHKKITSDIKFP